MSPPGQALGRRALWLGWPLWLRWLFWLAILALVTVVLVAVRTNLDQAHVTLIYLVVVLGGSTCHFLFMLRVVAPFNLQALERQATPSLAVPMTPTVPVPMPTRKPAHKRGKQSSALVSTDRVFS